MFAPIVFTRFADGAGGRIGPESFVISAAIIIAGQPESAGRPQDEESRGPWEPGGPPTGFGSEPAVPGFAEQFRGIEGREVRTGVVIAALKSGPGGIENKGGEAGADQKRLHPPKVRPHRMTERAPLHRCADRVHMDKSVRAGNSAAKSADGCWLISSESRQRRDGLQAGTEKTDEIRSSFGVVKETSLID